MTSAAPPTLVRTGIALGSNVGDRLAYLRAGFRALRQLHRGTSPTLLTSAVYRTAPVDCAPGTGDFLNAVTEIATDLTPLDLLQRLREVEGSLGRLATRPRNAPRTLDLDILYVGELALRTPEITLPHPRLTERRFVLAPLSEIVPAKRLPGQTLPVAALLADLPEVPEVTKLAETLWDG